MQQDLAESIYDRSCILVDLGSYGSLDFTVAAYVGVQTQRYEQPLWARRAPSAEDLTEEPSSAGWSARIVDSDAYEAQMLRSFGLA